MSLPTAATHPEIWRPGETAARLYTIRYLVREILRARHAYYVIGSATMPDHEYDSLETSLRAYCPEHPVLAMVGFDPAYEDYR